MTQWNFEADYFTACNCDWGCPCNFNARPTEGRCMGWGAWHILSGRYAEVALDDLKFALYYSFPGAIEAGDGCARAYIDSRASTAQRQALEAIGTGQAGGGIFDLFGAELVSQWLPPKLVSIEFELVDGQGRVRIEGVAEADSELLSYPDGSVIRPTLDLPHGIEYKHGLMTNTRRWSWHDGPFLASYANKYGAFSRVRFSEQGCIG
ncbi:DUF1326 domain-containing protein [Pseudomonas sp. EA_105y_Pfl2_R69]|jgi:hypothetical protein|uniref:DUF1326 domain-containing protein n=1 Tax=Pseudomonas sp. EA_105y_Pfl2_R69 TaxID=3088683 RepID=UPI0030D77C48